MACGARPSTRGMGSSCRPQAARCRGWRCGRTSRAPSAPRASAAPRPAAARGRGSARRWRGTPAADRSGRCGRRGTRGPPGLRVGRGGRPAGAAAAPGPPARSPAASSRRPTSRAVCSPASMSVTSGPTSTWRAVLEQADSACSRGSACRPLAPQRREVLLGHLARDGVVESSPPRPAARTAGRRLATSLTIRRQRA